MATSLVVRQDRPEPGQPRHATEALRSHHDEQEEHRRDGQSGLPLRDPPRGVRVRQGQPRAAAPILDRGSRLIHVGRRQPIHRGAVQRFRRAHPQPHLVRLRVGLRQPVPVRPQVMSFANDVTSRPWTLG